MAEETKTAVEWAGVIIVCAVLAQCASGSIW